MRDIGVTGVQTCALPICRPVEQLPPPRGPLPAGPLAQAPPPNPMPVQAPPGLPPPQAMAEPDRKSVVEGKSVDLGASRSIKQNSRLHHMLDGARSCYVRP